MHDVAAAKALRVLERRRVQDLARFKVSEVQHHRRRAHIYGNAIHLPTIIIDAIFSKKNSVTDAPCDGLYLYCAAHRSREYSWLTPQHREFHLGFGIDYRGLACQAIVFAQERLSLSVRRKCIHAAFDLHYALVALARSSARCRYAHAQRIGIVEYALAD